MTFGAEDSRAVGVVQEDEFASDLVLVRGKFFTENAKLGLAVAFGNITENLIIGAVFFDDINDMFKNRRFPCPFRNRPGGWPGRAGKKASLMTERRMFSSATAVSSPIPNDLGHRLMRESRNIDVN